MVEEVMLPNEDVHELVEVSLTVDSNRYIGQAACNPQGRNRSPGMSIKDRESVTKKIGGLSYLEG